MAITYRTDGAWGSGKGSNLAPDEVDGNFYDVDTRVTFIEDNPPEPIAPIAINIEGSAFTMGLSNGDTLGPIAITYPMPTWRGNWTPIIPYAEMDFFIAPDGGLGAVMVPHTSAATFDWAVIDAGTGLPTYRKLIGGSGATLALDGLTDVTLTSVSNGQLLSYDSTAGYWKNATVGSGTGTVTSVATGAGLTGGPVMTSGTISLDTVANQRVLANISGTIAAPSGNTMTAIIDAVFGSTRGSLLYRGSGGWAALGPGVAGNVLTTESTGADPHWATAAGGGASISISDTPPGSPTAGALWWDSVGGQLYLFYNDGSSSQWVPSSNQPGPAGPAGAPGAGISGLTPTRVPFAATATTLADDAGHVWDNTNKRLGIGTAAPTSKLTVSENTAALPAPLSNAPLHVAAADGAQTRLLVDAYGATPGVLFRAPGGTAAALSPTPNTTGLGVVGFSGYGTATFATTAAIWATAAQTMTETARGTFMSFDVTPNNSATRAEAMRIDQSGFVGIGTTVPGTKLHVASQAAVGAIAARVAAGPNGADTTTTMLQFADFISSITIGAITRNGTNTVAYVTTSDERLKTDIAESNRGLDALMQIKVSDYRMGETAQQGLLAQQVAEHYPEAVHEGGEDPNLEPWGIDYGRFTPLLIRTIQQQQAQIERLEERLAKVEGS